MLPGHSPALGSVVDFDPGSFRDRTGRVFTCDGAVYRGLGPEALVNWQTLVEKRFFRQFTEAGKLVETEQVDGFQVAHPDQDQPWAGILKHRLIPFISYAYEWSFGMLRDAALLQLELLNAALSEGMIVKDASPYNVQWHGSRPVFIDIPSFVPHTPGAAWVAYRQFCQLFLYPLLLQAYRNIPFQPWLRGSIEGIEPQHCWNLMSARDVFRPGVLMHVFMHARMAARHANTDRVRNVKQGLRQAGVDTQMIQANVSGLMRIVQRLHWRQALSEWSNYAADNSYSPADQQVKEVFVRQVAALRRRRLVWDLGANTGAYSRIAASHADYVVALERDPLCVERFYQDLKREGNGTILPLVLDLADPSVNRGWRGLERRAITNRAQPDLVLCLALIHHLVIGSNVPLSDLVQWLAGLNCEVVIEFVTRNDPMAQRMLRRKDDAYPEYHEANFERCLENHFTIVKRTALSAGIRILYHVAPKIPVVV